VTLDPKTVLMHPSGHVSREWQTRLPAGVSYTDVFKPDTWSSIELLMRQRGGQKRPVKDDLIRIIGVGFDVLCLVVGVDGGYQLEFYAGRKPSPVAQVLNDLDALPDTGTSSELKERAGVLRKRWAASGISRDDLNSARRAYAKKTHPDAGAVDGQRLAEANAILDAAMANLPEAA
jgi:hypothetical protein